MDKIRSGGPEDDWPQVIIAGKKWKRRVAQSCAELRRVAESAEASQFINSANLSVSAFNDSVSCPPF
jgi:hypothetical protein